MWTNRARIQRDIEELAKHNATPGQGLTRFSLTAEDRAARGYLRQEMQKCGLRVYEDAAGNLVDLVSQEQDVRFPTAQKGDALAGEFRYGLRFKLKDKGDYVVSVTVRDEATDEIGTAFSNVEI